MAKLTKTQFAGAHWYSADGRAMHTIPKKDDSAGRPTTITDAKRLRLYPSVTSVLSIMDKPGLMTWKLKQVALSALRTPKDEGESEDYWCKRVLTEAFQQVEDAADLGTRIHAALESEDVPADLKPYTDPVFEWKEKHELRFIEREIVLVNKKQGFGGTVDVIATGKGGQMCVIDFKTRKTRPGVKATPYDGQAMQGATYWGEQNLKHMFGANVFISTTEPGRVDVCSYTPEELGSEYLAFLGVCNLWRHIKKYDPRIDGPS
jgi:hypothetical protein